MAEQGGLSWGQASSPEMGKSPSEMRRAFTRYLVQRSLLFVPVNVPRFVEKAWQRGADAIILDLEDAVPPNEKDRARALVKDTMPVVARGGSDVMVRINKPFEQAVEDLDACMWPGLWGLLFPKVESPDEVCALDVLLTEREQKRGIPVGAIKLIVACETPKGLLNSMEIANSSLRIWAMSYGDEDLTTELMVTPSKDGKERLWGNAMVVQVATAAGIQALGIVAGGLEFGDPKAFAQNVKLSRQMGFRTAAIIHPSQVEPVNTYLAPWPEEIELARRIAQAFGEALAQGRAATSVDGRMIDIPSMERARRILTWAEAVEEKEERKRAALAKTGMAQ